MKFVKGNIRDLIAFLRLVPQRRKRIKAASASPTPSGPVNRLAHQLHPTSMNLVIREMLDETPTTRTFRLVADPESETNDLALFRAGQYLSVKCRIGDVLVSRPYSLSSSPLDALKRGFYEITMRKKEGGFFTDHVWNSWKTGTRIETSGPAGYFYIDPVRDSKDIVALAGGCGITPFRSMLRDITQNGIKIRFTLLYGIPKPDEIIFEEELAEMEQSAGGRIRVHYICSEPDQQWTGPTGFLSANTISRLAGEIVNKTFFICGPREMYRYLESELASLSIPRRRLRWEACGEAADVTAYEGFPQEMANRSFEVTVQMGGAVHRLKAQSTESLMVSLERAGLAPPSQCRSGDCGICRSRLSSGEVFVIPDSDGRRAADRIYGYIHLCSTYPLSDVELIVPRSD